MILEAMSQAVCFSGIFRSESPVYSIAHQEIMTLNLFVKVTSLTPTIK